MRGYVSGSSLQIANACAPSQVLPKIQNGGGRGAEGSAFHGHLADRCNFTIGDAMARIPLHAQEWDLDEAQESILTSRARSFEFVPPRGALAEVALGLMEDGTVRIVKGGRGRYEGPAEMRVATRIDVLWAEPEPLRREGDRVVCPPGSLLFVVDWKTGTDTWVSAIERNLQLLASAVLAMEFTGAKAVLPSIVYPEKGQGIWDSLESPLDAEAIGRAKDHVLEIAARVNEERKRYADGQPLNYVEGPWCIYCSSQAYCAAKIGTLKKLMDDIDPYGATKLGPEQLRKLAALVPTLRMLAEKGKVALKAAVEAQDGEPIHLLEKDDDGQDILWGPHPVEESIVDPKIGKTVLIGTVGEELAEAALKVSLSKTAIKEAVKKAHETAGITRQRAAVERGIFAEIYKNGGMQKETNIEWGFFKRPPKPKALPENTAETPQLPGFEVIGDDGTVDGDDAE